MKKRSTSVINISAMVFRNDHGFVARAVELPLVSAPAKTQAKAIKDLTDALSIFLARQADQGTLLATLDRAGFHGAIGSNKVDARVYSSSTISAPLPLGALTNAARGRHNAGEGGSHAG